jgi:hypothetical protein
MRRVLVTLTVSAAILIVGAFVPERSDTGLFDSPGPRITIDFIRLV